MYLNLLFIKQSKITLLNAEKRCAKTSAHLACEYNKSIKKVSQNYAKINSQKT